MPSVNLDGLRGWGLWGRSPSVPLCTAPVPGGQGHSGSTSPESDSGEQRALPGAGTHPHAHAGRKRRQPQTGSHGRRGPGRRSQLINATSEGTGDHISSNIFRPIVNFLHFHPSMPAPVGFTAESLLEFSEALPKRTKAPDRVAARASHRTEACVEDTV